MGNPLICVSAGLGHGHMPEWKLAAEHMQQAKYAALTANHTIGTFPKCAPAQGLVQMKQQLLQTMCSGTGFVNFLSL